jgi:hypothetical protein
VNWRLARSLVQLRDEVDDRWPARSKISDGTIGDAAHAARPSDHNPNPFGVVRALDITAVGIDPDWYAEHIRLLGATGYRPLRNHGYVIFDHRTASERSSWRWVPYTGLSAHTHHIHVSVGRGPDEYDSTIGWRIDEPEEDFMSALSDSEQRDLLEKARAATLLIASVDQRCARLEATIHGTDDKTRGSAIATRILYLYSEVLDNGNAVLLRRILAKFGKP